MREEQKATAQDRDLNFEIWTVSGQLQRRVSPDLEVFWNFFLPLTVNKRDYCFELVIICRVTGFHSPTKFVSLKQIHRCCEDLCSTEHIQGPKRALQTERAGKNTNPCSEFLQKQASSFRNVA